MKIEITGCNNCPFKYAYLDSYENHNYECSAQWFLTNSISIDTESCDYIPYECPIKLNNGSIEISIKQ